mmetsp:Transcript_27174/g.78080  ORF Transcript_27174/g.78080 Transcript_27174/m.78080 type:complete len:326 (+) Transcript_27174:110-1087(+)
MRCAGCSGIQKLRRQRDENCRRTNSWDFPPSRQFLITVPVCIADFVVYCLLFAPTLQRGPAWPLSLAFFVSFALLFSFGLWTTIVDPAVPADTAKATSDKGGGPPNVDKSFCTICRVVVAETSKHCWTCMKCVDGFDHHCVWLNTCIGRKNYWSFLLSAISLLAMTGTLIASVLACLFLNDEGGYALPNVSVDWMVLLVFSAIALVVNVPVFLADVLLVSLHAYLCYMGITTLQFIRGRQRTREAKSGESLRKRGVAGLYGVDCLKKAARSLCTPKRRGPTAAAAASAGSGEGTADYYGPTRGPAVAQHPPAVDGKPAPPPSTMV